MSAPFPGTREIAVGLAEAVRPALAAGASPLALMAARDVAQLMGLTGLEAALVELSRHAAPPRPLAFDHVAERIGRLVTTASSEGDITAFLAADRELAALAEHLASTKWTGPTQSGNPGIATIRADEALAELPLEASAGAAGARMTMNVASAVRAAIDWLGADESPRVTLDAHDSALTITVSATHDGGVGPAGAVLAAVDGSLGRETDGRWTLRVAAYVERPSFLLMRQGRYGVALPWHSVARLRMFAPHELERLEEPQLPPLSARSQHEGERPSALVALGLARAWFVADRIVWRIASVASEPDVPAPFSGCSRAVDVENGDRYWVLEPAWLLRGIVPPEVPPPSPRPRVSAPTWEAPPPAPATRVPEAEVRKDNEPLAEAVERALQQLRPRHDVAAPTPANEAPAAQSQEAPPIARSLLDPEIPAPAPQEVSPIVPPQETPVAPTESVSNASRDEAATMEPAAPPTEAPIARHEQATTMEPAVEPTVTQDQAPPVWRPERTIEKHGLRPSEIAERTPMRRALIADDSLVARIFLGRLLEKRGWHVESVPDAAGLWDALPRGPWSLICADIALPDAHGAGHVRRLRDFLAHLEPAVPLVVLTRDPDDERIARESGATMLLRKPFEEARLVTLLPD